jgi:hypothetical protein
MSSEEKQEKAVESTEKPVAKTVAAEPPASVFLVSYPKIVFFYPTLIAALVAAIYMSFSKTPLTAANTPAAVLCVVFLGLLATNMVILAFDFPRTTSLTLFFLLVAFALAGVLLFVMKPKLLPVTTDAVTLFRPLANAAFYWGFSAVLALIMLGAIMVARLDCWEARPNELLHRKGLWGDRDRFPAAGLRIDKEVSDVFEYLLLQSGRLILHVTNERRAFVLENVPFIRTKEDALMRMLGTLQVDIRSDNIPSE